MKIPLEDLKILQKSINELQKENQELKELVESLHKEQIIQAERIFDLEIENEKLKEDKKVLIKNADCCMWKDCINITKENEKLKKVIKFLAEQLDLDVDLENHNLITEEGIIAFVNADEETMSILELLREVLEE